jgi:hypothetical protein
MSEKRKVFQSAYVRGYRSWLGKVLLGQPRWKLPRDGLTVGRGRGNGLVVGRKLRGWGSVLPLLAHIYFRSGAWWIEALGGPASVSTVPVQQRARLSPAAILECARAYFRFSFVEEPRR